MDGLREDGVNEGAQVLNVDEFGSAQLLDLGEDCVIVQLFDFEGSALPVRTQGLRMGFHKCITAVYENEGFLLEPIQALNFHYASLLIAALDP